MELVIMDMSLSLNSWKVLLVSFACAVLFEYSPGAVSQPAPGVALDATIPVQLAVSIKGRNASAQLASALAGLSQLKAKPEFVKALAFSEAELASFAECADSARIDPSGRVFDLARCASIWPPKDKAPELKAFEVAYAGVVRNRGIAAFPAVKVSTFEYQEPVNASQLGARQSSMFETKDNGTLELKAAIRPVLCDPAYTFIEPSRCTIRVVSQVPPREPLIYVSQTGYRIELLREMPKATGQQLTAALRRDAALVAGAAGAARLSVGIAHTRAGALVPQGDPLGGATTTNPLGDHFSEFWKRINVEPSELELDSKGAETPPVVLLFDDIDDDRASDLGTWFGRASGAVKTMNQAECTLGELRDWHSDAAASQLVPNSIMRILVAERTGAVGPAFTGYLLSSRHFQGVSAVLERDRRGYMWFDEGAFDEQGSSPPAIGIVVYSDRYGANDDARVSNAVTSFLSSPSKVLVVSAGYGSANEGFSKRDMVVTDAKGLQDNCRGHSWPSCIGPHPRVIVVAPSEIPATPGAAPRLYEPGRYMLGRSTVKLAAYGRSVPVMSPCKRIAGGAASNDEHATWLVHDEDGTSFAAPVVGLLLARLVNRGDALVKQAPEFAVWRMLATVDPLVQADNGADPRDAVQYGHINPGRALLGVDEPYNGPGRAVLYTQTGNARELQASRAVVVPYPWNDAFLNVNPTGTGVAAKRGIVQFPRGVLPYTDWTDPRRPNFTGIDFRRVLRLVRSSDPVAGAKDRFDMYYISWKADDQPVVSVATIQIGGPSNTDPDSDGFCRTDGISRPASGGAQAQPACLYGWDPGSPQGSFQPIDLSRVDDIVLPPLHPSLKRGPVASLDATDIRAVAGEQSPWRKEFCTVGPRKKMLPALGPASDRIITAACRR